MKEYIEQFKNYCRKHIDFLPEEFEYYEKSIEYLEVKKKDYLLRIGEVETHMYYVIEGTFRHFLVKNDTEICTEFAFPDTFTSAFNSFATGKPSIIAIQAVTNAKILRLSKQDVDYFNTISKNSERFSRRTVELLYLQKSLREISLLSTTAEERYIKLLKKQPQITKTIAVKDLATYLGIHPESLSRIRKKVHRS